MDRRQFTKSAACFLAASVIGQLPAAPVYAQEPEAAARDFLSKLRQDPLEGLEEIVLEYKFETSAGFLGLPVSGQAQVKFRKNDPGYQVAARVKRYSGIWYNIGRGLSTVGLASVPNINAYMEADLACREGRFSPVAFRKSDNGKNLEEIQFSADAISVSPSNMVLPYFGEPCPFSMFFTYLLLHHEDTMEGQVINFLEKNEVARTKVATIREDIAIDGKSYDHVMRLEGKLMELVEGDVAFSLAERNGKRLPWQAYVPNYRGHEVYVYLTKAEPHYDGRERGKENGKITQK